MRRLEDTHLRNRSTQQSMSQYMNSNKSERQRISVLFIYSQYQKIDIDIDAVMYIDKAWSVTGFLTARETENKGVTDTLKTSL